MMPLLPSTPAGHGCILRSRDPLGVDGEDCVCGSDAVESSRSSSLSIPSSANEPSSRVKDVETERPHGAKDSPDRLDRRACHRKVVAHFVHVASRLAEVGLHVDDEEDRIFRAELAVVGPGIGISFDVTWCHRDT